LKHRKRKAMTKRATDRRARRKSLSLEARTAKAQLMDGGAPDAITPMEAAARLRIGRTTMKKLISERKVESFKIGRVRRIAVASIQKLMGVVASGPTDRRPIPSQKAMIAKLDQLIAVVTQMRDAQHALNLHMKVRQPKKRGRPRRY